MNQCQFCGKPVPEGHIHSCMTHGDLFSGIGGFTIAAKQNNITTKYFSEIGYWPSKHLSVTYPGIPNLGDIRKIQWAAEHYVDLVTAGFPCQPHSIAGLRKGDSDERDLSGEVIRFLDTVRPRFAIMENVPGLLSTKRGEFFSIFLGALAEIGYDCCWTILRAADFGSIQPRARLWIVAYSSGNREQGFRIARNLEELGQRREGGTKDLQLIADNPFVPSAGWPAPLICGDDDGLSNWKHRIHALGNSIYPEVAAQIMKILVADAMDKKYG